ncbi:MAG: phosphodiester glycosidase family protein [Pseudomonadota bacterium]
MRQLALAYLFLSACAEPNSDWPVSPCRIEIFEQSRFTVCDPGDGELRLIAAGKDAIPKRAFAELMADFPADRIAFAMNAGMFDDNGRPIGLTMIDGIQLRAINLRDDGGNFHLKPNGVFVVRRDGSPSVVTSEAFARSEDIAFATQSGPMLVIDGAIHPKFDPDGQSRFIRNGVGIAPNGSALFVISNEVVSFGKLARFFRDHLKTRNALYFDGSVSSLWDPANGRMDAGVPLGPMIVATKAEASAPGPASPATP